MNINLTFSETDMNFTPKLGEIYQVNTGGGTYFTTDETLTLKNGVLSVNTADSPEQDNTLPITSAAVHSTVGNIEILLQTI